MPLSPSSIATDKDLSGSRRSPAGRPLSQLRRLGYAALLISLLLLVPPWRQVCQGGGSPRVEQAQLKAVFLYNFLHFVTWPANRTLPGQGSAMVIGVVGDSPVRKALSDLAAQVSRRDKTTIRVVNFGHYREAMDLSACHILFISDSETTNMEKIVASLRAVPVLTVADTEAFLPAGGMITLLEQQNRIRYHINRRAATEVGLRLSSQLLKTAIDVQDGSSSTH